MITRARGQYPGQRRVTKVGQAARSSTSARELHIGHLTPRQTEIRAELLAHLRAMPHPITTLSAVAAALPHISKAQLYQEIRALHHEGRIARQGHHITRAKEN